MKDITNMLVVIDRNDDATYVLQKAASLAMVEHSEVHVIRVIYDPLVDFKHTPAEEAQRLKLLIMEAEEEFLVEVVDEYRNQFKVLETLTIWNKRVSEGAVYVANDIGAELIVKAVGGDSPFFPRHPDDWNLLRNARCPVLLVKQQAWVNNPVILAAVDLLDDAHEDMNERVLDAGHHVAQSLGGRLEVVNAYPTAAAWTSEGITGLDFEGLRQDVEDSIRRRSEETFKKLGLEVSELHSSQGVAATIVRAVAESTQAEIIVMGTAARKGVAGFIFGNTSETLLRLLEEDLLVISH